MADLNIGAGVAVRTVHRITLCHGRPPAVAVDKRINRHGSGASGHDRADLAAGAGVVDSCIVQCPGVTLREFAGSLRCRAFYEIAIIVSGTGQLIPQLSVLRNLNRRSLRVPREGIAIDDEINAVGILCIVGDAIIEFELNVAAERTKGNTRGIQRALANELAIRGAPTAALCKLADRQIADDRAGSFTGCSCLLRAARQGIGYAASSCNDRSIAAGFRRMVKA